jgi:hypothetical protein
MGVTYPGAGDSNVLLIAIDVLINITYGGKKGLKGEP